MPASSSTFNFKKIYAVLLFIALVFAFNFIVGRAYELSASKNKVNTWNRQRFADFYSLEPGSLDMVFVGSSHSYCTFDPEEIERLSGIKSFQMGMPQQHPDSTYYTLLEVFNYQTPKTVVFEVYWDMLDDDFEPKQIDSLFQVLDNPTLKRDYIMRGFTLSSKIMHYIKPIRFQTDFLGYQNSELLKFIKENFGLEQTDYTPEGREYYKTKGFIFCDYVMGDEEIRKTLAGEEFDGKKFSISNNQMKYISKIIQLCEQNNSELIFVTAPVSNSVLSKIKNYGAIHSAIASIASKNNIKYLDFNLVNVNTSMFDDRDFRDKNHLNYTGSRKACEYFVNRMIVQ